MKTLTMPLTKWRFVFLFAFLPILLSAGNKDVFLKPSNSLDCPTMDLIINSSAITAASVDTWLADNKAAFEVAINNLGGLWASNEVVISHDYKSTLPKPVCAADDGGLLVIFKATNSEEDAIRCGAKLIVLDDELFVPIDSEFVRFGSSTSLKASIDAWLITYGANLRNQIADGLTKESKEDLTITHDYNGILPDWTCQAENNNELTIIFTIEDKCGNIATHEKQLVVTDNRPPQLAILSPIEVERRESFSPESIGFVAATDECTPTADINLTYIDDVTKIDKDTILRKWMATDLCGNADSIMQLIKLVDREQFLDIPCAPDNVIISCIGSTANSTALNAWRTQNEEKLANACQNDAMDLSIRISDVSLFGSDCGRRNGGSIITYTISDGLGNFTIKKAKATIIDNTPPIFGAPMRNSGNTCDARSFLNIGLLRNNFLNTAYPFALSNIALESDCSNVQLNNYTSYIGNPNKAFPKRKYERFIFDFRDQCGNRNVQTPFYFAQDTLAPKVTCEPLDRVHTCIGDAENEQEAIAWNEKNLRLLTECSSTECFGIKSITSDYNFIELSGKCSVDKSLRVTYKVTDAFDNTTVKLATFSISNTDSLQVTCEPLNGTHACNGFQRNSEAAQAWNAINIQLLQDCAAGQCGQIRTSSDYNFNNLSNQCGLTGELIVNYFIEDDCSIITKTATFSIIDNRNPNPVAFVFNRTIMCEEDNGILEEATAWNETNLNNLRRAAIDNCGNVSVSSNFDANNISKACGLTGAVNIIYTITDECGLTTTKEAEFKVEDETPPVVNCFPSDLKIGCLATTARQATVDFWNQKNIELLADCANDNCGDFTVSSDFDYALLNGNCIGEKNVFVTYTVMDDCGNATQLTATIKELQDTTYTPNCSNVEIKPIGNQVSVFNLEAPYVILTIFNENWEMIYECNGDCKDEVTVTDLNLAALYHVKVQFFDVNQQFICERIDDITTDTEPCDLSICQENVILRTQSAVDAFCGCEVIEGDLRIGSATLSETNDITSLANLSLINTVKENVSILGTRLVDLAGLDNLKDVGGTFGISVNEQLEQIDALKSLNNVGPLVSIFKNSSLKSIEGFSNLQVKELETLRITGNPSLKTLKGLEGIEKLYGAGFQGLTIEDNAILEDVSALNSIQTINGKFFVRFNPELACCSLLHLVDFDDDNGIVRGTITLFNNSEFCNTRADIVQNCIVAPPLACEDIQVLTENNQITITGLTVPNEIVKVFDANYNILFECNADCPEIITIPNLAAGETHHTDIQFYDENWQFICEDKQDIIIEGGNEPCDTSICQGDVILRTQAEVDAFCGCAVIEGDLTIGRFSTDISFNDISSLVTLSNLKRVEGNILIRGTSIENLIGLNKLKNVGQTFLIQFNPLLKTLSALDELATIGLAFNVSNNELLIGIDGLSNFHLVGVSIIIESNRNLASIQGLSKIRKASYLSITNNASLENVDGLENVDSLIDTEINVSKGLRIAVNEKLIDINGIKNLNFIANELTLAGNPLLKDCCPISKLIDDDLINGNVNGVIIIQDNAPEFCSSTTEIIQDCQTPPLTCENIQIQTQNNQIVIEGLTAPNEIIKVFDKDYNILYECNGNCEETQIAGIFPEGNYTIDLQLYDEDWEQICAEQRVITLTGTPIDDCATIEVTTNNQQITVTGLTLVNESVTITTLPASRLGTISTTTFYQMEGDFTLMEMEDQLILDFAENYSVEDSLPGLYLYLTNDPNSMEDALEIGKVETFEGQHSYEIEGIDLNQYDYLLYYCKPFRIKIGAGKINTEKRVLFECTGDCGDTITTEQLPEGAYQIEIELFNQEGTLICDYQKIINLESELPCKDINIAARSNPNELVISTPSIPNSIIKVFDANYQIIFDCTTTCEKELIVPVGSEGIYHTDVQFYDENWTFICEDKRDIEVIDGGEPCDTSICAGDVFLRTQAEMDAFCGCRVIEGNLRIGDFIEDEINVIHTLKNLENLREVKGSLSILNTKIEYLIGLENLVKVNGTFGLTNCNSIENLQGLNNLKEIGGSLSISRNAILINLKGLNNLSSIGNFLLLNDNPKLISIAELEGIEYLNGISLTKVPIQDLIALRNIKNPNLLDLDIFDCDNLITFEGLEFIKTVNKGIAFNNNDLLEDISAISNILDPGGDVTNTSISIHENPVLSNCCPIAHLIDNDLSNGAAKFGVSILNNAQFCNSIGEIIENCQNQISLSCTEATIQTTISDIVISNLNAPIQIVKVFDANYGTVYECFAECEETINLPDLAVGRYHVNINFYDENWQPICERIEIVEIAANAQDRNTPFLPTDFALFPNPAEATTTIDLSKLKGESVQLILYNQFGQTVSQQNLTKVGEGKVDIDLSTVSNGLYILKIASKGRRSVAKKLIVNKLY